MGVGRGSRIKEEEKGRLASEGNGLVVLLHVHTGQAERCWHAACASCIVMQGWCRQRGGWTAGVCTSEFVLGSHFHPPPNPMHKHTQAASSGRPPLPRPPPAPTRPTTRYILSLKKVGGGRACKVCTPAHKEEE